VEYVEWVSNNKRIGEREERDGEEQRVLWLAHGRGKELWVGLTSIVQFFSLWSNLIYKHLKLLLLGLVRWLTFRNMIAQLLFKPTGSEVASHFWIHTPNPYVILVVVWERSEREFLCFLCCVLCSTRLDLVL